MNEVKREKIKTSKLFNELVKLTQQIATYMTKDEAEAHVFYILETLELSYLCED